MELYNSGESFTEFKTEIENLKGNMWKAEYFKDGDIYYIKAIVYGMVEKIFIVELCFEDGM